MKKQKLEGNALLCKEAGRVQPRIDLNKCSGAADCIPVCPYQVLEMQPIALQDKAELNFVGKLKTFFNAQKAYVVAPLDCHACGFCVTACPEKAIQLGKVTGNT